MGAIRRGLAMELASALAEISSPVIPIPFPFHQPRRAKKAATTQSYGATASFRSKRTAGQEKEIINLITPKQKQWGTNSNHQSKMGEKNAEAKNPNQQQQNHTHTHKKASSRNSPGAGVTEHEFASGSGKHRRRSRCCAASWPGKTHGGGQEAQGPADEGGGGRPPRIARRPPGNQRNEAKSPRRNRAAERESNGEGTTHGLIGSLSSPIGTPKKKRFKNEGEIPAPSTNGRQLAASARSSHHRRGGGGIKAKAAAKHGGARTRTPHICEENPPKNNSK
jgi:hypothetical protein